MAKEQKAVEPAAHSTGDPHAVYPTHYDVKIHTLRPEGVDLDVIVGGIDGMGIAGAVGSRFNCLLFFCHGVLLLSLNIKNERPRRSGVTGSCSYPAPAPGLPTGPERWMCGPHSRTRCRNHRRAR